ncbi:MAG: DUF58 domain-containing protein [Crocinitomicaceae bacterium]|nr:DUF58 domain-containing protein [Crocinitomicaceae bacterium]|tara:strand:+ start:3662 stop:4594 length:933 start_codon:yes stop_codon:yes gene_type:complete
MPLNPTPEMQQRLGRLELLANQAVEGFITGLHKSPFHGFSVEFDEHRLYNPGESTKHIDWKLYARSDKMFIKRYEEETNLRCQIVIDASSSMRYPSDVRLDDTGMNKLKFSVESAAALVYLLKRQRDAVGLSLFSDQIDLHTQARSSTAHHRMLFYNLEVLVDTPPESSKRTSAIDSIHEIAEATQRRSLVIIFSDMLDKSENLEATIDALQHLRHRKHEVVVFHVLDKSTEIAFDFDKKPTRFVDLESGAELKLHPVEVKEHYVRRMSAMRKELETRCGAHSIDLIDVDINEGPIPVLARYLIKRKKLF